MKLPAKPRARRTLAPGFMSQRFHISNGERLSGHCSSARLGFRAEIIGRHGMLHHADASLHGIGDLDREAHFQFARLHRGAPPPMPSAARYIG